MNMKHTALIKNKKGFSTVELLLALFIVAFVFVSVLGIFIQSVDARMGAEDLTRANAAAQAYVEEKLYAQNYVQALAMQGSLQPYKGFYVSCRIKPHGTSTDAGNPVQSYVHIIYTSDGKCLIVAPDGKNKPYNLVPTEIKLSTTTSTYTLIYDGVTISGSKPSGKTVVVVNAMKLPEGKTGKVTLNSPADVLYYCTKLLKDKITIVGGTKTEYINVSLQDQSLVHATVSLYADAAGKDKLTDIESMIQLSNS